MTAPTPNPCLAALGRDVLLQPDPAQKAALTAQAQEAWQAGDISEVGAAIAPERPARPELPVLLDPKDMPRRRAGGSPRKRAAMLHALAHIELNAIRLVFFIIMRDDSLGFLLA